MPFAPHIGTWDRAAHRLSAILYRRLAENRSGRSIVSFTFDDFAKSAYRRGGEILSRYGARGTYYASFKLLGSTDAAGDYFGLSDIEDLLRDGHELGCHTFAHQNHLLRRASQIRQEFAQNDAAYRATAPGAVFHNFAYPYGLVGPKLKQLAGRRFASARGTRPGLNKGAFDLNDLRASPIYAATPPGDVADAIADNERQGGWLIFVTHEVCDEPSSFGCTPGQLEAAVEAAAASSSRLLTIAQALEWLGRPAPDSSPRLESSG